MLFGACRNDDDNNADDNTVTTFDGTYSGYAYEGTTRVGSYNVTINNGNISANNTNEADNMSVTGTVNAQGDVTATTVDSDEHTVNISATISGSEVTGTWKDTVEGDIGTITGSKE